MPCESENYNSLFPLMFVGGRESLGFHRLARVEAKHISISQYDEEVLKKD